jgi:hypothetical protein
VTNRLEKLLESYQFATERPPPSGYILVHNRSGFRGFRAWWAKPGEEFVLCGCGWRADLGEHYRVDRPGSFAERRERRRSR